jgi:hypothetical protein
LGGAAAFSYPVIQLTTILIPRAYQDERNRVLTIHWVLTKWHDRQSRTTIFLRHIRSSSPSRVHYRYNSRLFASVGNKHETNGFPSTVRRAKDASISLLGTMGSHSETRQILWTLWWSDSTITDRGAWLYLWPPHLTQSRIFYMP